MSLSRSTAFGDRDGRVNTDRVRITDGAHGTAALKGSLNATLVHTKITTSAAGEPHFTRRRVPTIRWLNTNGVVLAKSLVYLALFVFVSAIALIYKYVLLALIYAMGQHNPAELDRDAVVDALNEIEKDSRYTNLR